MKKQEIPLDVTDRNGIQGQFDEYTPLYRSSEANAIYHLLDNKECVSLIGLGTVGKTHFLKHFRRENIFEQYKRYSNSSLNLAQLLFVLVDPQMLLITSDSDPESEMERAWAGYELLMSRLDFACAKAGINIKLEDLYGNMTRESEKSHRFALRQFEIALYRVLDALPNEARLVIVIDEFERFLRLMPASFFINLRGLRDTNRYQLFFMTVSRSELYQLGVDNPDSRIKMSVAEGWFELFKTPVYLRPAINGDLLELTRYLNARLRKGAQLTPTQLNSLIQAVGGHGGLLRTGMMLIDHSEIVNIDGLVVALLDNSSVRRECEIMLESCTKEENACILAIAKHQKDDGLIAISSEFWNRSAFAIRTLFEKGLMNYQQTKLGDGNIIHHLGVTPRMVRQYLQLIEWYGQNSRPFSPPANPRNVEGNMTPSPPPKPTTLPDSL